MKNYQLLLQTSSLVEKGLVVMQETIHLTPRDTAPLHILAWNYQQLQSAFTSALNNNYAAGIVNVRAAFEGIVFMRKYRTDKKAAAKWLEDLEYNSDKTHAIILELKKTDAKFTEYYEHYRALSKLSHPYPKTRLLLSKTQKGRRPINYNNDFNETWATVVLAEILFAIVNSLNEIQPVINAQTPYGKQLATFQHTFSKQANVVFKQLQKNI
ncbi:MAG: hypothetical protein V1722_04820 [Candidatus Micrarchaeota archaeon]